MTYQLAPHVSVCFVSDQAIFLDLRKDRYLSVAGGPARAVQAFLEQRETDEVELAGLVAAGLLEITVSPRQLSEQASITAAFSLIEQGDIRPAGGLGPLLEVAISLSKARCDLRRRRLASILDDIKRRKGSEPGPAAGSRRSLFAVAATFNAARRRLPFKPNCLPDSLGLLAFLSRRRLAADLVFGVKLHPFSAHCWVQAADVVLNDALDHATLHSPILVV